MQVAEEQAALDALGELGLQRDGAQAILLHPCQVIQDVASKALGRAPTPDVTLAAVHALATIAGHTINCRLDLLAKSRLRCNVSDLTAVAPCLDTRLITRCMYACMFDGEDKSRDVGLCGRQPANALPSRRWCTCTGHLGSCLLLHVTCGFKLLPFERQSRMLYVHCSRL